MYLKHIIVLMTTCPLGIVVLWLLYKTKQKTSVSMQYSMFNIYWFWHLSEVCVSQRNISGDGKILCKSCRMDVLDYPNHTDFITLQLCSKYTHLFVPSIQIYIYIYILKKGKDLLRNQKVVVWEKYLFLPIITCDFYLQEKQENLWLSHQFTAFFITFEMDF